MMGKARADLTRRVVGEMRITGAIHAIFISDRNLHRQMTSSAPFVSLKRFS